jgi:hypothetical protein
MKTKKAGQASGLFLAWLLRYFLRYGFMYKETADMATTTIVTMILHLVVMLSP